MDDKALEANYSWNMSLREIWNKLRQNEPGSGHYQKLALLAELKVADAMKKWTVVMAIATGILVVLSAIKFALPILHGR